MLEVVPVFVLEREVVGCGDVPAEEDEVHCEPCDEWSYEEVAEAAKGLEAEERAEQMRYDDACGRPRSSGTTG